MAQEEDHGLKEKEQMSQTQLQQRSSHRRKKEPWQTFVCNREKKTCLGRGCCSWLKLLLFYLVFYIALTGLFVACYFGFMSSVHDDKPTWSLETETPYITTPAMKTIPTETDTLDRGTRRKYLDFSVSSQKSLDKYVESLKEVVKEVRDGSGSKLLDKCGKSATHTCDQDVSLLGDCDGSDGNFGYDQGEPCIAMRINKIHNWIPELHKANPNPNLISAFDIGSIPVTCEEEAAKGYTSRLNASATNFKVFPAVGFKSTCFPFCTQGRHQKNGTFVSPTVMIKLLNFPRDKEVFIWCKMWLGNIKRHYLNDLNGAARIKVKINN